MAPSAATREVDPAGEALFEHPFVVLSGDRPFLPISDAALANLRLYIREGGLLFVDDATGLERRRRLRDRG